MSLEMELDVRVVPMDRQYVSISRTLTLLHLYRFLFEIEADQELKSG